jgi:putative glutamine amidotransferase
MKKPLIGATTYRENLTDLPKTFIGQNAAYSRAIMRAGGIPVMIPVGIPESDLACLLDSLDGVVLTGGADINPARYGVKMHPEIGAIDQARDEMEIPLVRMIVEMKKPFLGICRGFQMLNVALGGTLFTHVADQLPNALHHPNYTNQCRDLLVHTVSVEADSQLAKIFGSTEVWVNSLHHQGVDKIAKGLRPTAFAPDTLAEGLEMADHPFGIAVQWHPEALPENPQMQALFEAFVDASK